MIKNYIKSLLLSTLGMQMLMCSAPAEKKTFFQKINTGIDAGTSYLLSSGNASPDDTSYAHELFKQIDEKSNLPKVKKMNKLVEYLFGYKNTLSLPGINHIYINEAWINNLSEKEKRFVIGRALIWLKYSKSYLGSLGLMELLKLGTSLLANKQTQEIFEEGKDIFQEYREFQAHVEANNIDETQIKQDPKLLLRSITNAQALTDLCINNSDKAAFIIGLSFLNQITNLLSINIHRSIQYDVDQKTAEQFDCHSGAKKVLLDLAQYTNDGTILGKVFSSLPIAYGVAYNLENSKFWPIGRALSLIGAYPAKLHNSPNILGYKFKNLPLIHYFSRFPQIRNRISAVKNAKHNLNIIS